MQNKVTKLFLFEKFSCKVCAGSFGPRWPQRVKSISKNFQTEIIAQLQSITLFSHSSRKKAPSRLTRFRKFCLSETKNSNGILIYEGILIPGTRIIKKIFKIQYLTCFLKTPKFTTKFSKTCQIFNSKYFFL